METLDILKGAREILTSRGWTKGTYFDRQSGCYCLEGAVQAAGGTFDPEVGFMPVDEDLVVYDTLATLDRLVQRQGFRTVPHFNDSQASVEPVLGLLDDAIEAACEGYAKQVLREARDK
jgi:molybdopterin-guanine dinucleotide biosynthesis protein A